MELRTERLVLREFTRADVPAVHAFAVDDEVVRFMSWGPNTHEQSVEFVEQRLADGLADPRTGYEFAITLDGEVLGSTGIVVTSPAHRGAEFGYVLRRSAWGHGYATEAARRLVRFGFEDLGLHRIAATCDPANDASAHVLRKCGLRYEGHLRDHHLARGRWHDSLLFAALRSDPVEETDA